MMLWELQNIGKLNMKCVSASAAFRKLRPLVRKTENKGRDSGKTRPSFYPAPISEAGSCLPAGAAGGQFLTSMACRCLSGTSMLKEPCSVERADDSCIIWSRTAGGAWHERSEQVHGGWIEEALRKQFPEITWTSVEVKGHPADYSY